MSVSLDTLQVSCVDNATLAGQQVTISACAAWQNQSIGDERVCPDPGSAQTFRAGTTPETKAKCRCEPLNLPIDIRGRLRISKVTVPADAQSFDFTRTGTDYTTPFSLTNGQTNTSGLLTAGTYTATETVPTGWDLTNRACVITGTATSKTFTINHEWSLGRPRHRRGRHVHVHEYGAWFDQDREGRGPERRSGLQLHRERRWDDTDSFQPRRRPR